MSRTPPPRGRTRSRWMLVLTVVGALLAVPTAALAAPVVTIDDAVTDRAPLTLTLADVEGLVTVTTVDRNDAVARWTVGADSSSQTITLDLLTPDEGDPPVNGMVTVTVATDDETLLEQQMLLDATPPKPVPTATADGRRVVVAWPGVVANGPVTYRLERTAGDDVWVTLLSGATDLRLVDAGLAPDWYRYRLTASIPAAEEGSNSSQNNAVVRVAAPEPEAPTEPAPSPADPADTGDAGGNAAPAEPRAEQPRRDRPRPVAAAGGIRRAVTPPSRRRPPAPPVRTRGIALAPNVAEHEQRFSSSPVPDPQVAPARPQAIERTASMPLDQRVAVPLAPSGQLAVDAGRAATGRPATLFLGLLGFVASIVFAALVRGWAPRRSRRAASTEVSPDA